MNRGWDTSKYPPKFLVTLCQVKVIYGHEVKKAKLMLLVFGSVVHVFGHIFAKTQKHDPRALIGLPKSGKFENRKTADISVNSVDASELRLYRSFA